MRKAGRAFLGRRPGGREGNEASVSRRACRPGDQRVRQVLTAILGTSVETKMMMMVVKKPEEEGPLLLISFGEGVGGEVGGGRDKTQKQGKARG